MEVREGGETERNKSSTKEKGKVGRETKVERREKMEVWGDGQDRNRLRTLILDSEQVLIHL